MYIEESQLTIKRLQGLDSYAVKNAFFANYLASIVMLRLNDTKGLALVNDKAHVKLTKFSTSMSDLNFWGRALFYSDDPAIKKMMAYGHAEMLADEAGRIITSRIEKTMMVPLMKPTNVNWPEVCTSLILLRHRFSLNSTLFDRIVRSLYNWSTISTSAKQRVVGDSFLYLMQADSSSNLLGRMRALAGSTMINDIGALAMKLIGFSRLNEEGEAVSSGNIASTNAILNSAGPTAQEQAIANTLNFNNVSNNQVGSKKDADDKWKKLKKKARKFKAIAFRAPTHFKKSLEKK